MYTRGVRAAPRREIGSRYSDLAPVAQEDGQELRTGELWPWLWLTLRVLWLAEGMLANRTVG